MTRGISENADRTPESPKTAAKPNSERMTYSVRFAVVEFIINSVKNIIIAPNRRDEKHKTRNIAEKTFFIFCLPNKLFRQLYTETGKKSRLFVDKRVIIIYNYK